MCPPKKKTEFNIWSDTIYNRTYDPVSLLFTGFEFLHLGAFVCKTTMMVFLASLHLSAWLIVAVTADRFLAVWIPLKASVYCTVIRARWVSLVLLCVAICYNLHIFWTIHLYHKPTSPSGKLSCSHYKSDVFMEKFFPYLKLTTYSILPFTMVLLLNISITYKLWHSRKFIQSRSESPLGGKGRSASQSQHKITIMLLVVSFIWLSLTAPFMLWSLVKDTSTDHITKVSYRSRYILGFLYIIQVSPSSNWIYHI